MESVITNERDERFIELTKELDNEYFQLYGDIVKKYEDYNDLADPHIVIIALNWGKPIACASFKLFDVAFKRYLDHNNTSIKKFEKSIRIIMQ